MSNADNLNPNLSLEELVEADLARFDRRRNRRQERVRVKVDNSNRELIEKRKHDAQTSAAKLIRQDAKTAAELLLERDAFPDVPFRPTNILAAKNTGLWIWELLALRTLTRVPPDERRTYEVAPDNLKDGCVTKYINDTDRYSNGIGLNTEGTLVGYRLIDAGRIDRKYDRDYSSISAPDDLLVPLSHVEIDKSPEEQSTVLGWRQYLGKFVIAKLSNRTFEPLVAYVDDLPFAPTKPRWLGVINSE